VITEQQYFGAKPHTQEQLDAARDLLARVNALVEDAAHAGIPVDAVDPDTGSQISGSRNGQGDGGFRLPAATTGRIGSSHKEARGVDRYDPRNALDNWLSKFDSSDGRRNSMLEKHDLYREHPATTGGWCHLTTRAPGSGKRTFFP
jgi:hypothetical protein